uniref:(northern house mosquito) hypothetical protein n=1 Tax=Culex pipiens TaxID=7175 RepID=A0A8D8FEE4_CULPI
MTSLFLGLIYYDLWRFVRQTVSGCIVLRGWKTDPGKASSTLVFGDIFAANYRDSCRESLVVLSDAGESRLYKKSSPKFQQNYNSPHFELSTIVRFHRFCCSLP